MKLKEVSKKKLADLIEFKKEDGLFYFKQTFITVKKHIPIYICIQIKDGKLIANNEVFTKKMLQNWAVEREVDFG